MSLNRQLIEAAENGDLENVKYLLRQGADIHNRNDLAVRRAAQASGSGHLDVIRFLHPLRLGERRTDSSTGG